MVYDLGRAENSQPSQGALTYSRAGGVFLNWSRSSLEYHVSSPRRTKSQRREGRLVLPQVSGTAASRLDATRNHDAWCLLV